MSKKCNTPKYNIATKLSSTNLIYNNIFKYYLDDDKIPGRSYLTDDQWGMRECARMCRLKTHMRCKCPCSPRTTKKGKETRLMLSEGISRPNPRRERSVQVKTARKKTCRQKTEGKIWTGLLRIWHQELQSGKSVQQQA